MRIIRDFEHCLDACKGAVIALGNFDGVHLGHIAIIDACLSQAKKLSAPAAVMTFEPHPREFFRRDHKPMRISRLSRKLQLLEKTGLDTVFLARFNHKLASTSAQHFVDDILHRELAVRHVITGYNFAFGKGREGNTAFLENALRQKGIGFTSLSPVNDASDAPISSSAIRTLLAEGKMAEISALLGRPYSIDGRVRGGDKRGRELGFPTANLWLGTLFQPRFGIYAARVMFKNGSRHDAVVNLGIRPMFAVERPLLEVHCFDLSRMFYGERIEVELVEFIREEEKFDTIPLLREAMVQDCEKAKIILEQRNVCHG
jgi:riboflavin kinase / FMN adenylyltransferase